MRRILIIAGIALVPVILIILISTGVIKKKPATVGTVKLTMWGTTDPATAFATLIDHYRAEHGYVSITYKQVSATDYQTQLLQAWAQGNGPDIFFAPHTWVNQMAAYSIPEPANIGVPIIKTTKSLLGKTQTVTQPLQAAPNTTSIRNSFTDAVGQDVINNGKTWGRPMAMAGVER